MQICMGEDDCGIHAVIYLRQWKQAEKRVLTDKRPENAKNNQNLADFAAENSKVKGERNSNPGKLPWEPTRTESKLCTAELARRGGLATAVTPFDGEGERGLSLRAEQWGQWMRGLSPWNVSQEWRNRQRPEGQRQRPSFQELQYWLDWGLPEDASGSVSDKAEDIEVPRAAEVVTGDLLWEF